MGERKACAKSGRNARSPSRRRYWAMQRLQKRREARIKRHILAHPNDLTAPPALRRVEDEPVRHIVNLDIGYRLPGAKKS